MNRTVHLIVNPFGGTQDNRALAHKAFSTLNDHGIKVNVDFSERKGHAMKVARSLSYAPEKTICGLGGDGTMHEIINGIMCRPPEEMMPVGLLPGGTGNSFLEDVGVFNFNDA
ncbi:acylglycerol kinase family protein, partial [Verrucomicrobia bacterium]|nr:acylglycerol kinase family protein [Verrucomicrobiota bacterium]